MGINRKQESLLNVLNRQVSRTLNYHRRYTEITDTLENLEIT